MNLDEIDREVRVSLRAHADDAPSGAGTLDAVRTRSHRLQVRRRAGLAGVAVLATVAAAVGVPYALSSIRPGGAVQPAAPGSGPATVASATAPVATAHASRVALGPSAFTPITFPLDPTFAPAGLLTPTEGRTVGEVRLVYTTAVPNAPHGITASVTDKAPGVDFVPDSTSHITVNGHPATLYTGTTEGRPAVQIDWKLHAKWVTVAAVDIARADVEHFAVGLAERPKTPTPLPFTLALAPQGYQVDFQEIHPEYPVPTFYFNLSTPADLDNQLSHNMLGVVASAETTAGAGGAPIRVGGYPAKINHADGMVSIYVLRPGFTYEVHEAEDGPLSEADLIRFAAGVGPR